MGLRRRSLACLLTFLTILHFLSGPAKAQSASVTAFSMDSESGEYVGRGKSEIFTPANSQFHARGNRHRVEFYADDGSRLFGAIIGAPTGQSLTPGTYETQDTHGPTNASLNVFGDGRGCGSTGFLTIHEISFDPADALSTFAASYEQRCEGHESSLFGELRFNSRIGFQAASNPPEVVIDERSGSGSIASIEFASLGPDPLSLGEATVEGTNPRAFQITSDACSGATIEPGAGCSLQLRLTAHDDPPEALLRLPDGTHRGNREVLLSGIPLLGTSTRSKLLGSFAKRGKYALFHHGDGVLQIATLFPRDAGNALIFEAQRKRGGSWTTVARASLPTKRGKAAGVFGGRRGSYRARALFPESPPFDSSDSGWRYFRITS